MNNLPDVGSLVVANLCFDTFSVVKIISYQDDSVKLERTKILHSKKIKETFNSSLKNITFLDVPIDTKYKYVIVEFEDNGYDAINVVNVKTLFNLDESMELVEELNNKGDYSVTVEKTNFIY